MRVLIVGIGSIAKKHIQALNEINPNIEIIGLRSSSSAKYVEGIKSVYNFEDLFNFAPFDFAIISNPTSLHSQTIEKLIYLNIPLFIEKPLFNSLDKEKLLENINNQGINTYVACNLRFLDSMEYLKNKLIPQLKINEVNVYCGSYLPEWRNSNYKLSYSVNPDLGGGVHLDLIHELDYIYWLFGKPQNQISVKRTNSSLKINSIDYANYILEYNNFAVSIVLNYYRRDTKRCVELVCEDNTFTLNLLNNTIYNMNNEVIYESKRTILDTYKSQLEYFIKNKTNINIMNNINEAYEVLKICLT